MSQEAPQKDANPELFRDRAFWGMTATQFLGAFNDNLFKQLLLLMFVAVPVAGGGHEDMQGIATAVFALSFILFSGFAGYVSDLRSKRGVIVCSKVAELVIMALGATLFAIYAGDIIGRPIVYALSGVLFLMGAQSAFFAPGKYGILPEIFRPSDLPVANGIILMTTFLAIIFGTALAGVLLQWMPDEQYTIPDKLWVAGIVCVGIALLGIVTSLPVRSSKPANPHIKLDKFALFIPKDVLELLRSDGQLLRATMASTAFWATAAMVQLTINAFGKLQLVVGDFKTSIMVSSLSIGIAVGSLIAGSLSKDRFHTRMMKFGAWGLSITLFVMAPPGFNGGAHLLGYEGSIAVLILMGTFTGIFAVPLQVFVQNRPPAKVKGRMIATQSLLNWIGIIVSALVYGQLTVILENTNRPPSTAFGVAGVLMLAVSLFYRPQSERLK